MNVKRLLTVTANSTYHFAKKESGGKGFNLFLLNANGVNVPPFITLTPQFFEIFKEATKINDYIAKIFLLISISLC
jgi:phosphoenolpyruvate synthase/pyruvate phosphate dikinase